MKFPGIAVFLAAMAMVSSASASNATAGSISNIAINGAGIVSFHHSGGREAPPACQTQASTVWVFSAATPQGQAKLSFLLTAYSLGKQVTILGTSDCAEWGDTETANVMFMVG